MIVTLIDGCVLETSITNCTGYRASEIRILATDIKVLEWMLEHQPTHLRALLIQLRGRFRCPSNVPSELRAVPPAITT